MKTIDKFKIVAEGVSHATEAYEVLKNNDEFKNDMDCVKYLAWWFYSNGNFDKAVELFKIFEDVSGDSNMGLGDICYIKGDYEKSYDLYLKSFELGERRVCYWLGYMKYYGFGTEQCAQTARYYLNIGSELGYLASLQFLNHINNNVGCYFKKVHFLINEVRFSYRYYILRKKNCYDERITDFEVGAVFSD